MTEIVTLLNENGYETVEGASEVISAIKEVGDGREGKLCSGYGVFPTGEPCEGCSDCEKAGRES